MYKWINRAALIIAPLAPAAVFGGRAYQWLAAQFGWQWLSIASGISAAIALESVGALAGYTAMRLYRIGDRRWIAAALALAIYGAIGAIEAGPGIGRALFGIVLVLYAVAALNQDAADMVSDRAQADMVTAERQHELALVRAEYRHAERMAARSASSQLAVVSNQLAASYHCAGCGAEFSSPQALGGHRRHCAEQGYDIRN